MKVGVMSFWHPYPFLPPSRGKELGNSQHFAGGAITIQPGTRNPKLFLHAAADNAIRIIPVARALR